MSTFQGFTSDVHDFLADLADHNDRAWFQANKKRYETSVKAPMEMLFAALESEFGTSRLFRINRDVRFSHDKSPYKTEAAGLVHLDGKGSLYVGINATGVVVGAGAPHLDSGQLRRYREALDGRAGAELVGLVDGLHAHGCVVGTLGKGHVGTDDGDLKRVPSPYPQDHPMGAYMKLKALIASRRADRPAWLLGPGAVDEVAAQWREMMPILEWPGQHVGASTAPPRHR